MGLATKYRPHTLEGMAGNALMIKSLRSVLDRDLVEIPHAFLFTGPRGCGKTTVSRIVGEELGCDEMDFEETDAAKKMGVEEVRELRKNMHYSPMKGDIKVYFLDECHLIGKGGDSASNEAQNALLKALEEPPPHVYFILATTDPQKLLKTIRSRCVTFNVEPLQERGMIEFLRDVVSQERKRVHPDVLKQIANDSLGSPRDALQILEKVIDLPAEEMKEAAAQVAATENQIIDLIKILMDPPKKKPWKEIAPIVKNLLEGEEPERIRRSVLNYCTGILLNRDNPQAWVVADYFKKPFFDDGKALVVMACYEACEANR